MKYLSYLLLSIALLFNLILYFPETKITLDPNDNIFQFALVERSNTIWERSHCPFSLNCLPNLIDHWVPNWAEGYALPYYYSHLPQVAIVSTYNLIVKPVSSLFSLPFSLYAYYNWIKYLLLCLFPLAIFLSLKIIGFNPLFASFGALFSTQLSTDGLYGIDPPSFLWRGYGLTSQLYSMFFIPLAIAFTYKALEQVTLSLTLKKGDEKNIKKMDEKENQWVARLEGLPKARIEGSTNLRGEKAEQDPLVRRVKNSYTFWAILFTILSISGHLGIGVILILTLPLFLFLDFKISHIKLRFQKLAIIIAVSLFALSYWIVPAVLNDKYHLISFWDPIWKFNSWGLIEVTRQFFSGEIFDFKRLPIITILTAIGFFLLLLNKKYFVFSFIFLYWILFYFGRSTWGPLIDIIPGMKDFHQSRFIVGVQLAALFLVPAGLSYFFDLIQKLLNYLSQFSPKELPWPKDLIVFSLGLTISLFLFLLTTGQTIDYATLNNKWVYQANTAYNFQYKDYSDLLSYLNSLPPDRIYAGRPGNWGRDFRFSSTQMYLALSVSFPISQFLPESWSPSSDNEEMFDDREPEDYNLYNLRYIVAPQSFTPPKVAKLLKTFGAFYLYEMPTTGYFDVVSSTTQVFAGKETYVNIVHVWQKSYVRYWNMYPLITLGKDLPPPAITKTVTMTDLVNFKSEDKEYNIFAASPFVFPQATVSGQVKSDLVSQKYANETYSAQVTVPPNCTNCFTLFKMTYFPNWQAKLDGQPVDKYAIFPFYMAVATPPGTHTIEFNYSPSGFKILLLIFEILVFVAYLFRKKIRMIVENKFKP